MGRHGENIHKRKDGRWEARLITGYGADGKAIYRYLYGKSYLEVKEKRNSLLAKQHTISNSKSVQALARTTFEKLAREWLTTKRGAVKESTYAHYSNIVEKQFLPELGELNITAITAERLELFLRGKLQSGKVDGSGGLSNKTVSDLRAVLNLILQFGQMQGLSQLASVRIPSVANQTPAIQTFTKQEQMKLENVLFSEPKPLHLGILIALYAGLRIGEVCALQWKDYSRENGTVSVSKTIIRIRDLDEDTPANTKILIDKPKTQCSIRTIPLPEFILAFLEANERYGDAYLLTGTAQFMEPRVCLAQYKKVLKKAGIPDHNFHALRHTFATRCVEESFDVKSLSEIMGHSNVSITMQRYVHPSLERKREQMNKLSPLSIHSQNCSQEVCQNA